MNAAADVAAPGTGFAKCESEEMAWLSRDSRDDENGNASPETASTAHGVDLLDFRR
jgi:hypothetical protein